MYFILCIFPLILQSLTSLRFLTSDDVLPLEELKNLEELELGDCTGWDNMAYSALAKLKKLHYLKLENGGDVPDKGLCDALLQLQCLEELHLVLFKIANNLGEAFKRIPTLSRVALWPVPYKQIMFPHHNKFTVVEEAKDYPCGGCKLEVHDNQRGLQCEGCLKWFHARCGLVSSTEYRRLGRSSDSWICPKCEQASNIKSNRVQVNAPSMDVHELAVALVNNNVLTALSEAQHLKEFIWGIVNTEKNLKLPHLGDDPSNVKASGEANLRTQVVLVDDQNQIKIPMLEQSPKVLKQVNGERTDVSAATGQSPNTHATFRLSYLGIEELHMKLVHTLPGTKVRVMCCKAKDIRYVSFSNYC